jgi:tetratricopeptide (TPR) repeat protein
MIPKEEVYQKLRQWQQALSLTDSDTGLISAVSLSASRLQPKPRQNDLKLYEQLLERMLAEARDRQSSLRESDRHELQALQQVLHLPDEDVAEIARRLDVQSTQSAATVLPSGLSQGGDALTSPPSSLNPPIPIPFTEIPFTEIPSTQIPSTQIPSTQIPSTPIPSAPIPSTEIPSTQIPSTQIPSTQIPSTQIPSAEIPLTQIQISSTEIPSSGAGEGNQPANLTGVKGQMVKRKMEIEAANTSANAASVEQAAELSTGTAADQPVDSTAESSAGLAPPVDAKTTVPKVQRDRRPLLTTLALLLPLLGIVGGIWLALRPYLKLDTPPTDPKVARQFVESGTQKNQQGQYAAAIQDFDQAIRFNAQDATTYLNRGFAQHRMGRLNAAVDDYTKALTLNNKFAEAFSNRSHARFDQGQPDAALKDAAEAIAIDPKLAVAHLNLGNALFAKGNMDGAFQKFSQTLQLNPPKEIAARAHNNQGNVFANQKKIDEAIQAYTQAIQLDAPYADAFFNRALAFERKGNRQGAIDDFRSAANLYKAAGNNGMSTTSAQRAKQLQKSPTPAPPTQAI